MLIKKLLPSLVLLLIIGIPRGRLVETAEKFEANDNRVAIITMKELVEEREQMINYLRSLLKSNVIKNGKRRVVCSIVDLLGEYRASQAIEEMLDLILYHYDVDLGVTNGSMRRKDPAVWSVPAVRALVKIGIPAIPKILENIKAVDVNEFRGQREVTALSFVLFAVLGRDLALKRIEDIQNERNQKVFDVSTSLIKRFPDSTLKGLR